MDLIRGKISGNWVREVSEPSPKFHVETIEQLLATMSFEIFANVSAVAHVGFFVLESLLFDGDLGRKIFGVKVPNEKLSLFAYNQVKYH